MMGISMKVDKADVMEARGFKKREMPLVGLVPVKDIVDFESFKPRYVCLSEFAEGTEEAVGYTQADILPS